MAFEEDIAKLNEHFFFKEFTYSRNTFRPTPSTELELADSIIWLDRLAIVFQLKERGIHGLTTPADEERWFDKKVVSLASRQIRDSITYLDLHQNITLENHRGHQFQLEPRSISKIHKIICYLGHEDLPLHCRNKKFHRSRIAGVIHLIAAIDYAGIVRTVLTLSELSEYLDFRHELIEKWSHLVSTLPESALMGQYLAGDPDQRPDSAFIQALEALEHRADEWDLSGIIKHFPERVTTTGNPTDYYAIVAELAKLKRNELQQFKTRFQLSMEKCASGTWVRPYRMATPRTQCGFMFLPLTKELIEHRNLGLLNHTIACKYDLKLPKCIGISFFPETDDWFSVEWCYLESPWEYDEELDQALRNNSPFRDTSTLELPRYTLKSK